MPYRLLFQPLAERQLSDLERMNSAKHRRVLKCLGLLEQDPRYPSLHPHRYEEYDTVQGQKIWESYVENRTAAAFRVFWHFGPTDGELTVVAITPHP